MNDHDVSTRINALVEEEHQLLRRSEDEGGLTAAERGRLNTIEVALDQCWDLLRQRRARRHAGLDPNDAEVRDPAVVERYQQ